MVTRRIGFGIIVSSDDAKGEAPVKTVRRKRAPPRDFFAANGIAPPSALFDTMPDTFYFAKDVEGRFVWANRLLQQMHRLPDAADTIGKCDRDFLREDIAERIRADDIAVMAGAAVVVNKLEAIGEENGAPGWLCTTKKVLRNRRGEVIGVEGVSRVVAGAPHGAGAGPAS